MCQITTDAVSYSNHPYTKLTSTSRTMPKAQMHPVCVLCGKEYLDIYRAINGDYAKCSQ